VEDVGGKNDFPQRLAAAAAAGGNRKLCSGGECECSCTTTTDFIAGGGNVNSETNVGTVEVCNDGAQVTVTYTIEDDDWCLDETHLAINKVLTLIPQTKTHNPIPGKFRPSQTGLGCVESHEETISNGCSVAGTIYIAAHGVVKEAIGADLDYLRINLPDTVQMSVTYPSTGAPSYFQLTVPPSYPDLAGTYLSWCIDTDNVIYENTPYNAAVYSSYDIDSLKTHVPPILDDDAFYDNLPKVNYIINQDYVGNTACGGGTYTYGDVQRAIWELIENAPFSTSGLGTWTQAHVDCIKEDANTDQTNNGPFVPGCGDSVAVIFAPATVNQVVLAQVVFGEQDIAQCIYQDETAWADGTEFAADRGWATYFTHTCC
jgi:hypothetical protein